MNVKKSIWMLGIAALLASCSSEDVPQTPQENVKTTTFTVSLDQAMNSRAASDDIQRAIVEVFSDSAATQKEHRIEVNKGADGKFTFSVPNLISGKKYTFLFWADCAKAIGFSVGNLKEVELPKGSGSDAYSLATTLTPEEISQSGVVLKHAICKITLQTTVDLTADDEIWIHYPRYKAFNVLTNSVNETPTSDYFTSGKFTHSAGDVIRTLYVFAAQEPQTISLEHVGRPTHKVLTNVPINPNKHIVIKGDFKNIGLTNANFSISFDENWESTQTKDI